MIDLQLPSPLLDPATWLSSAIASDSRSAEAPVLALTSLALGGPFAKLRENLRTQSSPQRFVITFASPENFWRSLALNEPSHSFSEPSLVVVIETQLAKEFRGHKIGLASRTTLAEGERQGWRALGLRAGVEFDFVIDPSLLAPTLAQWSREVFPMSFIEAGELAWAGALKNYEAQLSDAEASLNRLRFFPGFLRLKNAPYATTAAVEWAYAQALFSPQDDQRGTGESVILNPTLQTVTDDRESRVKLQTLWRVDGKVHREVYDWQIAAVIDELRETPRLHRKQLDHELTSKSFPLRASRNFADVIDSMLISGLLLQRK